MKVRRIFILLIILAAFTGCTRDLSHGQIDSEDQGIWHSQPEKSPDEIIEDFYKLVAEGGKPYELLQYIDENIGWENQKQATKMIEELLDVQADSLDEYNERLYKENNIKAFMNYFPGRFDSSKVKEISEEELKTLMDEVIRGGYCFITAEGSPVIVIDYEKLKKYRDEITIELGSYIDLEADESNNPSIMDMGFAVPLDEIARRIAKREVYCRTYKDSPRSEQVGLLNQSMIVLYLKGLNSSVAFDYETGEMNTDYIKSYEKTIENYPNTVFSRIVEEYLTINKKHKFNKSEAALEYIDRSELIKNYTKHAKKGLPE